MEHDWRTCAYSETGRNLHNKLKRNLKMGMKRSLLQFQQMFLPFYFLEVFTSSVHFLASHPSSNPLVRSFLSSSSFFVSFSLSDFLPRLSLWPTVQNLQVLSPLYNILKMILQILWRHLETSWYFYINDYCSDNCIRLFPSLLNTTQSPE